MVLVGVQPRFTQDPPTSPFSTMAVLRPALARATASGTPPCPAPMTTASNCSASPIACFPLSEWNSIGTANTVAAHNVYNTYSCLLYTSDAADDLLCVDL